MYFIEYTMLNYLRLQTGMTVKNLVHTMDMMQLSDKRGKKQRNALAAFRILNRRGKTYEIAENHGTQSNDSSKSYISIFYVIV